MDLSDDSFVWTDASNDSSVMAFDIKQEENDDELDTNYKRKSQEKSSADGQGGKKAKKRKHQELAEVNGNEEELPKHIKLEPESDFEVPKKKKKKKNDQDIPNSQDTQESTDYDDSYLNYRVKQEQMTFVEPAEVKAKKKRRHKTESESIISEELTIEKHEIDTDITIEENHIEEQSSVNEIDIKKKKKKSKRDTHTSNNDFETSDDNFKAKKKLKSKKQEKVNKSETFDKSNTSHTEDISCINSSTVVNHFLDDDQVKDKSDGDINSESIEIESEKVQATSNSKPSKEIPKISDRLRFEDEDSIDFNPEENIKDTNLSKRLKRFLNTHKNLSLIKSTPQSESILTEDDEIWIIKAPCELSIKNFKDINMKLDTKSKLKFNGQTYDSLSDSSIQKASILSFSKSKTFIQNVPVMGLINICKRIHKTHIPDENVLVNNQPNFVPLPEMKCRHPLFGVNYKKATKISQSIAEHLNDSVVSPTVNGEREKKKKHKKEKRKIKVETEPETKPLYEATHEVSPKKKRKRKSSIKEEPVSKKAKYIKDEPESGDVWESEQAIEKNLFDF